jgi:hypothetical protein
MMDPGPGLDYALEQVKRAAAGAGRDVDSLGMEGRVNWAGDRDEVAADIGAWESTRALTYR